MDKVSKIHNLFNLAVKKFNEKEKVPFQLPDGTLIYHSEIHTLVDIGSHMGINITELAILQSVTKGAVSQMANKLIKKELITKKKDLNNDKEINLYLTEKGRDVYEQYWVHMKNMKEEFSTKLGNISEQEIIFLENFFNVLISHIEEKH